MVPHYNGSIHSSLEGPESGNSQPPPGALLSAGREGTTFILIIFIHTHDMRMFSKGNNKLCQEVTDDTQVSISSSSEMVRITSDTVQHSQDMGTESNCSGDMAQMGLKKKGHFGEENTSQLTHITTGSNRWESNRKDNREEFQRD